MRNLSIILVRAAYQDSRNSRVVRNALEKRMRRLQIRQGRSRQCHTWTLGHNRSQDDLPSVQRSALDLVYGTRNTNRTGEHVGEEEPRPFRHHWLLGMQTLDKVDERTGRRVLDSLASGLARQHDREETYSGQNRGTVFSAQWILLILFQGPGEIPSVHIEDCWHERLSAVSIWGRTSCVLISLIAQVVYLCMVNCNDGTSISPEGETSEDDDGFPLKPGTWREGGI